MLGLVVLLFISTLLTFGVGYGLLRIFGNADSVKGALANSGIYQSIVEDALQQTQQGQTETGDNKIPLDRPEVQNIIKNAASPELLQTKTENALDSLYAWIHGETPTLAFNLEVSDIKSNLATGIEQYVTQHVASLPACTPGQAGNATDDPFNAACRPEGVDPAQLAAQTKDKLLTGEFMEDTTISADTIKTDDGQTLAQKVGEVPNIYQGVSWGIYGAGILALLSAIGVVFLSINWRSGIKKLSIIVIVVGVLTAGFARLAGIGIDRAAEAATEPLQQSGVKVAEALVGDLSSWWLWYGIALIVVGVAALVGLRFLKSNVIPAVAEKIDTLSKQAGDVPPPHSAHLSSDSGPSDKPQPKPPKQLVQ